MALTINTNISSLIVQRNLNGATNALNNTIERMTTGFKINHAKDNAAGFSIAKDWVTRLSSLDVASENASMGIDLLSTLEDSYSLISTHIQRIRDLTEQAANGTYGCASLKAIKAEIAARMEEIDRISQNCEYNGKPLMKDGNSAISLQVGIDGNAAKSVISLGSELFAKAMASSLLTSNATAAKCAKGGADSAATLKYIDAALNKISDFATKIGAAQNRVESAIDAIGIQSQNITSSLSTLRDADVAVESSNFIKAQILQQASATLLATANQSPSVALNLL